MLPPATARKSARCLNRSMATRGSRSNLVSRIASGAQPLAAARTARVEHPAAARGAHPGAKPVAALAHQLARLVGPLHCDPFSACRATPIAYEGAAVADSSTNP